MDIQTKGRLEQAKRRQRQKQDMSRFRIGISKAIGLACELPLHDLEEALALQARLYERLRELRTLGDLRVQDGLDDEQFEKALNTVLEKDKETIFLVFLCHWEHMGALVLSGAELLRHLRSLLEFDGDTVTACTRDFSRIVSFDRRLEDHRRALYEVDDWCSPISQPGR